MDANSSQPLTLPSRSGPAPVTAWLRPSLTWIWILGALGTIAGCAGYQLGNRSLYRTDIKTINVPMFQSSTLAPGPGRMADRGGYQGNRTADPYKVVNNPLADSVLTGRILWDQKRVLSENINDEPRNLLFQIAVHVTWIDNSGHILVQSVVSLGSDFIPEGGQSITSAEQTAVRKLAEQIVSQMEAPNW